MALGPGRGHVGAGGAPVAGKLVLERERKAPAGCERWISLLVPAGEPFSQEEMEEMLSAAIGPESNFIHYRDYITMMVVDEN